MHCEFELAGERLLLLPEKAIFWEEKSTLLLADLHLGKSGHFRKNGIAVPQTRTDLQLLQRLIATWEPRQVIFLGDLFHSAYNQEWEAFANLLASSHAAFELVMGNHDILSPAHYERVGLQITQEERSMGPFRLRHDPLPEGSLVPTAYTLAGHVHPGVKLHGPGRQKLRLPCFYFGKHQAILPAFGHFTGCHTISPLPGDRVFVIAEGEVISV